MKSQSRAGARRERTRAPRGEARFQDTTSVVPDLSARLLSERLEDLAGEEVVPRTIPALTPVHVVFASVEKARALNDVIIAVLS